VASDIIERAPGGVLLVGSVPLRSPAEVFRTVAGALGDRIRRIPDGETGPRSDWIVWQYPVLSSRPEFEVCPPGDHPYRSLPRLRLADDARPDSLRFEGLGYAQSALASYREFAQLKRDGIVGEGVRFQVALPTPLAPISAFIAPEDQARVEPVYEARLLEELDQILDAIPHDQLAIQWDTNFEFAMLDGVLPSWFSDVRAGVVERLLRLARQVPGDVELGYHFCHGHDRLVADRPHDARRLVDIANALASALSRPLNWIHLPVPHDKLDVGYFERLARLQLRPETELYLGLIHPEDGLTGARARIVAARRYLDRFGVSTSCGWGRQRGQDLDVLLDLHRATSEPRHPAGAERAGFAWPEGFAPIPDEPWTTQPVDEFGLAYDHVDSHGWYRNLDPTVEELAQTLRDGDILLDYSGGTGILLDRIKLRVFGAQHGTVIVDSSAKFLRVAVEKFKEDSRVGVRLLRFLKGEGRLERLEEVLGPELLARGVDVIASTNAIHLYPDVADTAASWARALRPGGKVLINSGNIRNPRARRSEWILDETVWVVADLAEGIVRTDESFAAYRPLLEDRDRMKRHAAHRDRVFLDPRPLDAYTAALESAGLVVDSVREVSIEAGVHDWYEFLSAYHDAVLGWVGGTDKIDGAAPTEAAVADRLRLMRQAMDTLFGGRPTFQACWTYITCVRET
jgi:SAM-dependent methyltransferase